MTVSATHDASAMATTASAAVPPSARISRPTSAVAGCPAAIPARMPAASAAIAGAGRLAGVSRWERPEVRRWPGHEERPREDCVARYGSEVAAVLRERAVVAEHEIPVGAEVHLGKVRRLDVVDFQPVHVYTAATGEHLI